MRAFIFLAALLCSLSSFAAARCDARVPTETVELGDVRLAYQSIGRDSDPALLLVMGLGGQLIHWPDEVVSALCEQGFRVIRYDNRDVGLSAWNVPVPSSRLTYEVVRYRLGLPVSAPYTLTDMAGDALHLLDALDIPQAHVLGASMGGMIAQHIADMAPQRLLSLTLVMTSSGAEGLPAPASRCCACWRGARRPAASRRSSSRPTCWRRWAARKCATIASSSCCRPHVPTTARSTRKACSGNCWRSSPNPAGCRC